MATCIDLEKRFGKTYRIVIEDGYAAKRGRNRRNYDPWLLTLLCQHGHIYPHGGKLLGASTDLHGAIANRLAALKCVRVVQDGDDGINAVFHVDDFDDVADILKPKRKRRLTPNQIADRTKRLRSHQFSPASQSDFDALKRDLTPPPDPKAA